MLYDPKWGRRKVKARLPEIYEAAADAINAHGHSRRMLTDAKGRMCLWGAINFVANGNATDTRGNTMDLLRPLYRFTGNINPVLWNNLEGRTKRQVVNLLRKAARSIASTESQK